MTGQDRSPKSDCQEEGQAGQTGRNTLTFVGRVSGKGQNYKKGGRTDVLKQGKFSISLRGVVAIL